MDRTQMTLYESVFKSAQRIRSKAARADFYDAVCAYGLYGTEPDLDKLSDAAAIGFISAKPNLDSSRKKAASGKQGGKSSKQPEANGKQTRSKTEANCKQTASEKEGEKEKEVEKEVEKENECYIMAQTVVCLPLNDGTEFHVTQDMVQEFSTLYPAVDVEQALRNMRGWLLNNPKNRKTSSGIRRFVNSWLSREQDKPRPQQKQTQAYSHGADRLAAMIEGGAFDD